MAISRRALLGATSGAILIGLGACTAAQIIAVTKQVADDTSLVASGLQKALPLIAAIAGIPAPTVTLVTGIVTGIVTAASVVASAIDTPTAQKAITQVVGGVSSITQALSAFSMSAALSDVLSAAESLLPGIQQAVGLAPAASASFKAMSPDQARIVLASVK